MLNMQALDTSVSSAALSALLSNSSGASHSAPLVEASLVRATGRPPPPSHKLPPPLRLQGLVLRACLWLPCGGSWGYPMVGVGVGGSFLGGSPGGRVPLCVASSGRQSPAGASDHTAATHLIAQAAQIVSNVTVSCELTVHALRRCLPPHCTLHLTTLDACVSWPQPTQACCRQATPE